MPANITLLPLPPYSYGFRVIDSRVGGFSSGFDLGTICSPRFGEIFMVPTVAHLSEAELEAEYVGCSDARRSRHLQTIRLLAKGHSVAEVSAITAYGERWIEQLRARYNAEGVSALGDQRRGNGAAATILTETVLAKLRERLQRPPDDGGVWSSRKVAAWMAGELGLAGVAAQRGWEALKAVRWSIQKPRPKNPKSASPEEAEAFKKGDYVVDKHAG